MNFSGNKLEKLKQLTLKDIPKAYRDDFLGKTALVFKNRTVLVAGIVLFAYIIGGAFLNLTRFGVINKELLISWVLLFIVCSISFILARKVKTVYAAKMSAMFLILMIISLTTRNTIIEKMPPYLALMTYAVLLFTFTLTMPWPTFDIPIIALLNITAFLIYCFGVQAYIYKGHTHSIELTDCIHGIFVLFVIATVCTIVKQRENKSRIKEYALLKEVEEKNKQMEKELELAARVHERLVPHSVNTQLADVAVTYVPMYYMGGDYAKFQFIDKNRLIFIIADVTGHGVSAALLVNAFNTEFERLAREGKTPGALLKEMNQFISNNFAETSMYLTAFCGLLDYSHFSRKFIYSSYGHPPQYIYRANKSEIEKISAQTTLLGVSIDDENTYQNEIPFNKGDQILLFTDGVIEAKDIKGNDYGDHKLDQFVKENNKLKAESFNQELLNELTTYTGNSLKDDVFILNIKTK